MGLDQPTRVPGVGLPVHVPGRDGKGPLVGQHVLVAGQFDIAPGRALAKSVLGQFGLGAQQVGDPAQIAQGADLFAVVQSASNRQNGALPHPKRQ